ncbi:hypothetical protein [Desulfovibrio falkowii]|uniref:Uncharacterized protein n=1 Tax=Desulfovibrio falkowii TaxID=3136602 RepID=A0ABQ0E7T7_9BACT
MKSIFLKQTRRLGFDHQAYSQFPPTGEFLARMDFISWFGTTQAVFFHLESNGLRFYVTTVGNPHVEGIYVDTLNKFVAHVQRGDLCRFTIAQSPLGQYVLQGAEIVEQIPLCTRRAKCQPSPCCVFKN